MTRTNRTGNLTERGIDGGVRFDCPFCDDVVRSATAEAVKDRGERHLGDHRADLRTAFAELYGGERCDGDCGYVFPDGNGEVAGFECPDCGRDNFPPFVRRYLYWQIEVE